MLKLYFKSLVFVFCLLFLLCIAPILEQPEEELKGRALQNFSLAEVGPLPVLHFQAPVFSKTEEAPVVLPANPEPMSFEDQLDDIAEKLDIIQQQVNELVTQAKANEPQKLEEDKEEKDDEEIVEEDKTKEQSKLPEKPPKKVPVGGGAKPNYLKILISEIQISPIGQRFIELYNPDETDVNLTGWYLMRKTSSEYKSFISKNKFAGKIIFAKRYFLISKTDASADIFKDDLILTPDNSFVLKNPNQDISDELILTGQNPAAGKSLCRENFSGLGWKICLPTPKTENQEWVEPPINDSGDYFPDSGDYFPDSGDYF